MPEFSYIAIDALGRRRRGRAEAASESALESFLEGQGQWLFEVRPRGSSLAVAQPKDPGSLQAPRRLVTEFFLQLGIQLKAGIPVLTALGFGANECAHPGFRRAQQGLIEQVQAGAALSEAMRAYPRIFPPLVLNLMRAGEMSGRMAETCQELHQHYEWLDRLMSDVRQALLYPALVLFSTLGFILILFTYLIPRFAALLKEMNAPLPFLTRLMIGLSDFLVSHWAWVIGGPIAVLIAAQGARRLFPRWAVWLDRLKLALPLFGPLQRLLALSRFAHNLAVLYRAGVPLLEALKLSRGLVGNRVVEEAIGEIEAGVNGGVPIHEVMSRQPVFSKLILQMVKVGESTGSLGESLQNVADYYNDVIPRQIKKLFALMEPAMILFLIGLVGTVALAIYLPIVNLLGSR